MTAPLHHFERRTSLGVMQLVACLLLGSALTSGCSPARSPSDLLACADRNFSRCRALAAHATTDDADALRAWACARGDDESCFERVQASHACHQQSAADCPLVGEKIGEAGVIANRRCRAGSAAGCALARELGHRSSVVFGTTLVESAGTPLGFLDEQHLLTASSELTLWRVEPIGLQRVVTRPFFERATDEKQPVSAEFLSFAVRSDGGGSGLFEVDSKQYSWLLEPDAREAPRKLPERARVAAFTPDARALLVDAPTSNWQRYGLDSSVLRVYDSNTLRLIEPGVELGVRVSRVAASNQLYAGLEPAGAHVFDRKFGVHTLLRSSGVGFDLAFSGDGRWLAMTSNQMLQLYDVSASPRLIRSRRGVFGAIAFSKNGERLAVETERGVELLDAPGLSELGPELRTRAPWAVKGPGETHLLFGPSGSSLLVERADQLLIVSLASSSSGVASHVELPPAAVDPSTWFKQLAPIELASLYDARGPRDWKIEGSVTLDHQPVPGANVELVPNLSQLDLRFSEWRSKAAALPQPAATTTDDAGRFRFAQVPWIPWSLQTTHPGLVQRWFGWSVTYLPGQDSPLELQMERCAALRGRVTLANGAAGTGFKVFVSGENGWLVETRTDTEGVYRMDCLRPSRAHLEAIGPNGEAAYLHVELESAVNYHQDLSAKSFDAKSLERLLVIGDDGKPVADAEVKGYPGNDRTGPSGRWASARPARVPPAVVYREQPILPKQNAVDEPWTLRLPTAELFVVHPKLASGDAMTLGRVTPTSVEYANGVTEAGGTRFSGLSGGRWTLWHVDDRGRLGTASIELGPREAARVEAPIGTVAGIVLTGVIVDHDSGKPVLGASVRGSCFNAPNNDAGGRPLRTFVVETDPAGRFQVPCVARDQHTFWVWKNTYLGREISIDARTAGSSLKLAPVRLRRARPNVIRRLLRGL